jgi:nucleoside-diphosphate-sugar epimerase
MRYLITGAQGFTGRYVVAEVLRRDPQASVVATGRSAELADAFTHELVWREQRFRAPLPPVLRRLDRARYRYVRCALERGSALEALVRDAAPDVVIHLAAALRDDPDDTLIRSNVAATLALVQTIVESGARPLFIIGSSGSVYGTPDSVPLREDQRCLPHEPYAMSKLAAELVTRVFGHAGLPAICARIFNIAGPGQEERHVCGRFAAQAAAIALGDAPPVLDIGDLRPTRDFIDVRDVAAAIYALAINGIPGETYNVASGRERTIRDVLDLTLQAAGLEDRVSISERYARDADVMRAYADITKLRACGFKPGIDLDRTIADLVHYYTNDVTLEARAAALSAGVVRRKI